MFNYEGKDQDYMNFAEYMRTLGKMPSQEYTNAYMSQMNPEALGEANMESEQPQDDSWGGFRGFAAGGAGVLQGQAQLGNLAGFGDGSTANYMGEIMQRNARKKEYTIADMFPFASDYWTSGEGAAYDIGNMLGSSVVLGGETALAAATGGAALGALGVGNAAAAAATAASGSATAARAAFMTKAITGGMGRAAAKLGMPKLGKVLEGPMGTLYAMNILKTPLEASSEAGNAGAEALANGASLSDAQRQALIVGGLQMPLLALSNSIESSGLGGLFLKEAEKAGGKKLGKEGLLAILGNITREGVNNAWEEGMQQSTHEYAQGKQNLPGVVNPFQWSDEALQQAAVGGVGGLAIGGGNAAMRAFGTRGGDEAATPQAQETAEAQENTTMPETPAQEETVAEPIAPTTPAESAAEYLDTISQQDENLSMEQRRGIWDVLDSGNEQAIVDVATQFGWQPPVEQAAPAPVTPATTPEQQIQTAVDNVNAATANVANGGEVVEPAAVRPPMPVVESISGGGKVEYPTNPPTFGVAENPVDQNGVKVWLNSVSRAAHEKLSKGNKTRKYLDSDGNINTMALRASPALRRFIDGNPNAVENLKAALSGNKEAMAWFSKLSPTRQAALVDVLNHGAENWQVTDGDRRSFALYDLRQQLYQKAKNLKGKAKTKLYASLKNSDDNELIKIAKEHGLAIPDIVYGKSEPTAPIATPTQPVSNNTTEPIAEPATNAPIEEPASEPNASGGNVASAINAIINGNKGNTATPARNKRLAPISIGGVQTIPQVSSDGTKLAFSLPEVFLPKQTVDDMKAAGFFYNSELKAIVADNTETAQNFLKKYAVKESGNDIDNGGKENETDKNGEGSKGGDQGSENPVQNKEPQEPVKAKTGDDQGEDKNGETGEVDTPKSEPEKTTDENGVTPIPHDAKPDAVKKLQQANTEIIMGKVKAIEKQYEDGELDANAARKAISAFFQKYSQSKAVNKAYSAGTDEKINSIKKGITAKEAEKKRAAAANAASADKQAKEEAKQKKKKLYQDTLSEFDEKANAVLSKHKEQELSDVDAIAELDKITKELEERLVANDDKLLVKDKKNFYEDRVKTIKKQQAEIDKAILEAATTEAIAGSSESLTPEGLEAYKWVKQQLSADAKKRYSEKGIDAVAALIAFRAQTWSKLYNKYAKTNFTPLTFAQRYKFVLHDGRIPKFEKSGGVTHTIEELGNKQSHIDMAITSDEGVLVHELGHVFFADFVAVAESPDAPAQLKKDLAILREWIGDGQRSEEELKKPYRQSAQAAGKWRDEERFSQALVKHVYAGDTPVSWLNKMFAELKSILEAYIKGVQFRINKALASPEKTKETEGYAKAYRTDFEIPSEIKRIINEMIYYKEANAVTYDDKMQVIKALNNELDATFNEEQPPDTKRFNELKQRIAAAGKGSKEYSPEQNAVLEAASKACQTKAELGLLEQKARIAYNEVEEGNVSAVNVESAASALLEGDPMEFETIPKEARDLLLKGLDKQQRNDVADLDVEEEVARAVVTDYAVEGKLDDEFEQVRDDLKAYGVEEGIKSVEKYADYVLCMLHKYAAIYNKQKKLEEAEKAYEDTVAALKKAEAEKKLKELVDKKGEDNNKAEDGSTTPNPFDYLPEKTRKSKLGKAMYQAAWHGSPHIIEGNLTTKRIGTGEGAIVHGWGLYFAKSRGIAQERYRERLLHTSPSGTIKLTDKQTGKSATFEYDGADISYIDGDIETEYMFSAAITLAEYSGNKNSALKATQQDIKELEAMLSDEEYLSQEEAFVENDREQLAELKAVAQFIETAELPSNPTGEGSLLKVELPENDVLLDENKPFKQQPYRVRTVLKNIAEKMGDTNSYLGYAINKNLVGRDLYRELGKLLMRTTSKHRFGEIQDSREMASRMLNDYGIKGIRYDGQTDGECFVIFDDNAIAIKERYDAALRRRGAELQRSREEVVGNIKKMFAGSKFDEQENGDLLITTKNGKKLLYKISDRIVLNEAEAQEARKAHGISEDVEVTAEGRYRPVYESDIDSIVEVGLDSRKNTEAHEATHAVIDLALGKEKAKPLFDRAEKLKKEYGLKADAEEIACDAVRDFVTARENGFITTFTTKEVAELKKTFWGRMLLKANSMGAKAKVFSDKNEAELKKTAWGKMLLAKMQLQRGMAKLMRAVYDFYKKFQAVREANDNFHNLARKIELGEVWGEKISTNREKDVGTQSEETVKYSARYAKKDKDIQVSSINLNYKKQLEDAFARNATDGEITYIMNQHQKELAEYFKDRGEKRKEHAKLRAAELKQLRNDFKAGVIDSYEVGGMTVRRDAKGKEVVEKLIDELPNRTYENKRHENEDFKNASASAKLGAAIKREKPKTMLQSAKDWLKEAKDNFYKQWVDKYDALRIFDKAIEDKSGKRVHAEQTVLGKMQMVANYASGAARAIIEGDKHSLKPVADTYHIKNLTPLKDMMEKLMADCKAGKFKDYVKSANLDGDTSIQGYINALENYLTALTLLESSQNHKLDYDREVAEWQNKGSRGKKPEFEEYKFPNNMTEDEIKDIIRSAPKEFRQYQVIFKGFTDNLLDIMLNSGLITADRYDTLKTRYKFYCPLMRDFSDTAAVDDFISQINSGKGLGNVSDPLKSRSSGGSVRDVISPLTTAVKTASAICMKAERNRVGQYMVRQAKKHRLDEFVHEVKGNNGDANNCIFTVMINGEKHAYQTTPELYPAITAAVKPLCEIQMALLTKPAQLLRAGSTMSPSFIIRNFLRDTLFASVASKNGFIPIYDSIRGGYALLKNRERRGEFDAAGVISSNFYSDAEAVQKSLIEMAGGKSWQELTSWEIVKALVSKPVAGLEWVSNLIEASTRMGEFMRARDKGKSVEEAAYDAVEITLNFGRSGATGQQINRMIPFFNACIQGGDKLYRLFKSDPKTTMLRIGTYIILPSIVLWAANHDKDWYKELDPAIKMNNWILPGGSIRIPKPQEAGVLFGSGFEAALDAAAGQDQKAMGEWATTFLENMTPGVMPTLILPLIEWMANYSFFRNKPVVSQSMQRLPDELQYGPYTSETSKFVGGIAGVSPAKLDNLWRGYTGTMGMFLIQAPDLWAADKQNLPEKKLSEMAFVRDFAINDMNLNRTMNDFYRLKEAATKQHAGYGKKGKPTAEVAGVNVAAQSISKLQKEAREITASPKYNSAQKRVLVDKLQAKQKKIAQLCIKKYGNKFDY